MRITWLLIGFMLGVWSQDDDVAARAYDLGVWTRCVFTDCTE